MSVRIAGHPAAAPVDALRGRTVVDAYCDAEGDDDVHLVLDDGTQVWVDVDVDPTVVVQGPGGVRLELSPRGRFVVAVLLRRVATESPEQTAEEEAVLSGAAG